MQYFISPNLVEIDTKRGTYAYNSLFGNLTRLKPTEVEELQRIRSGGSDTDKNIAEKLYEAKYILKSEDEEKTLLHTAISAYRKKIESGESITKLLLMVTEKCMLNCKYCYVPDSPGYEQNKTTNDMTWETAKEAIDVFRTIIRENGQKRVHIRFHGGEPLLNFPLIKKSICYITEHFPETDVKFHINTNGVVMNKEMASFLCRHNVHIEVSLDGTKDVHNRSRCFANGNGSYNYAISAIEMLRSVNPTFDNINLAVTLNKYNYQNLNDIVDLAAQMNLREIEVNTLLFEHPMDILEDVDSRVNCLIRMRTYGTSKGIAVSGKWFKLYEHLFHPVLNYCGRMGQQIGVNSKGDVFLCTGYMESFGHVDAWRDIIRSDKYIGICMRVIGNIDECYGCTVQGMCAGGCTASVIKSYEKYDAAERKECEFRKKMAMALIKSSEQICNEHVGIDKGDNSYIPFLKV